MEQQKETDLHGHEDIGWFVEDLFDSAIIAFAKLLVELELIHADGKLGAGRKVDALCMENGLVFEIEGARRIAGWDG